MYCYCHPDEITDIAPNASWIIGNVKQRFYYRVNYNEENWIALQDALMNDHEVRTLAYTQRYPCIEMMFNFILFGRRHTLPMRLIMFVYVTDLFSKENIDVIVDYPRAIYDYLRAYSGKYRPGT